MGIKVAVFLCLFSVSLSGCAGNRSDTPCDEMRSLFSMLADAEETTILQVPGEGASLLEDVRKARKVVRTFSCASPEADDPGTYWVLKGRVKSQTKKDPEDSNKRIKREGEYYANYGYMPSITEIGCKYEEKMRSPETFYVSFWKGNRHSTPVSAGLPEPTKKSEHFNSGGYNSSGVYAVKCEGIDKGHDALYQRLKKYFRQVKQGDKHVLMYNLDQGGRWKSRPHKLVMNSCGDEGKECPIDDPKIDASKNATVQVIVNDSNQVNVIVSGKNEQSVNESKNESSDDWVSDDISAALITGIFAVIAAVIAAVIGAILINARRGKGGR